jgi:hypothetical protein
LRKPDPPNHRDWAFSSVQTDFDPAGEGVLDATLRIEEARARGISLSLGFDSFEGGVVDSPFDSKLARDAPKEFCDGIRVESGDQEQGEKGSVFHAMIEMRLVAKSFFITKRDARWFDEVIFAAATA